MTRRAFDDLDEASEEPNRPERPRRAPVDSQYRVPETEGILRRVIEIIDGSPGLPMSASVRVNKDEVLELLEDAVSRLPDELRSAKWLLKEREEFRARGRKQGEELIAEAQSRAAHMVQRTEVVKAADQRAAQIIEEAEAAARRMRRETEDYCDQKLASFENVLARISKTVVAGRDRLSGPKVESKLGDPEHPRADAGDPDDRREAASGPVFDQDQ